MGSFLRDINPIANLFGSQSSIGKMVYNDPVNSALGHPWGNAYGGMNTQGSPGLYAGRPASMAAAQTGYGTLLPAAQPSTTPLAVQNAANVYGQATARGNAGATGGGSGY